MGKYMRKSRLCSFHSLCIGGRRRLFAPNRYPVVFERLLFPNSALGRPRTGVPHAVGARRHAPFGRKGILPVCPSSVDYDGNAIGSSSETRSRTMILVVEDDESVRRALRRLLEDVGYRVIDAGDGQTALLQFHEHADKLGLILLDVVLPGMRGIDVYREIRRQRPGMKVILTSGYSVESILSSIAHDDDLEFIGKPVSPEELIFRISCVMSC